MRVLRKWYHLLRNEFVKPSQAEAFGKTSIWPLLCLLRSSRNIRVAEVGVYKAESSVAMLETWDIAKFYAIDLWKPYEAYVAGENSGTTRDLLEEDGEKVYNEANGRIGTYGCVEFIRQDSVSAARFVENASLDFCFIDANHELPYVTRDIETWLPKVKAGGILAGHDFFHKPVRMAVADIVRRMNVAVKIRGFHHSGWPSCWYIVVPAVEQWPEKMNSN